MTESQYISGLIAKAPPERSPDYVRALLSIKREELIAWLQGQSGDWINAEVKVSSTFMADVSFEGWHLGHTNKEHSIWCVILER